MKIPRRLSLFIAACTLVGATAVSSLYADQFAYGWTSEQSGFYGNIYLSSNESASGSFADVITIRLDLPDFGSVAFRGDSPGTIQSEGIFGWTPGLITSVDVTWTQTPHDWFAYQAYAVISIGTNELAYEFYVNRGEGFLLDRAFSDTSGSWLAGEVLKPVRTVVPDSFNTSALIAASLFGLISIRFLVIVIRNKSIWTPSKQIARERS